MKPKLFEGEKWLVITSLIGFAFAALIALYISFNGSIRLPEGRLDQAFSFNAAIAMFTLSIAAFLPVSGVSQRKKAGYRWFFISAFLYSYFFETIQHFRGVNPRFTNNGSLIDLILGIFFGVVSLLIVIVTVLLAIQFFRSQKDNSRPLLILSIRYAFLSVITACAAGIIMIVIQGRYTGPAGNLMVLHGIGFHALQTIPLLGWLQERMNSNEARAKKLIHTGGIAWTIAIFLIGLQTALGASVFEWSLLPVITCLFLLVWLITAALSVPGVMNRRGTASTST